MLIRRDYILNHRTESVVERVKEITNGKGVDLSIDDIAANASILPDIIAPHGTVAVYGTSASDVTYPSYGLLLIVFPSGSSSFMNFIHRPAGSNLRPIFCRLVL